MLRSEDEVSERWSEDELPGEAVRGEEGEAVQVLNGASLEVNPEPSEPELLALRRQVVLDLVEDDGAVVGVGARLGAGGRDIDGQRARGDGAAQNRSRGRNLRRMTSKESPWNLETPIARCGN